jgi:hypothetical protein
VLGHLRGRRYPAVWTLRSSPVVGTVASPTSPMNPPEGLRPNWGNVMVTLCWAAKGGSGTTVVASTLALRSSHPSVLVDLDGEVPAALGLPEPDRPGVGDWLATSTPADQLGDLLMEVAPLTWLLPWRSSAPADGSRRESADAARSAVATARWSELGGWLSELTVRWGCEITIDAGTGQPPPALAEHAHRSLLVTRPCYLSLRRAVRGVARPTGVVLVDEPGRALTARDIEHALGVPVEATVSLDPLVARAVDAGLLSTRLPRVIARELRRVAA